jgi:hypothetical protein
MDIDIEHDFSALINYEAPIEGLSFSYTYHFAKVDAVANDAPFGALTGDLQIDLEITQHTAGFEYFYLDWTLSGEHTWHQNEMGWNAANGTTLQAYANLLNGLGTGNDDKRRWYLLLSRQITDKLSAELGYSHLITNRNLKSMPSNYRRTYSIASRYDINENFLVKLQFDYNSGYADTISASESIVNGLIPGQKWNTILLRATFQF